MRPAHLIWIIPLKLLKAVAGVIVLLLIAVACLLYVPSLRMPLLEQGVRIANEQTDYDIDLGRIYLSPFHHSPALLYRAYRGEVDLPLRVEIDSLFVGHRGVDTLAYIHSLRLQATCLTAQRSYSASGLSTIPIAVDTLVLDRTTFHSDSLIASVGVDVILGRLAVASPRLSIAEGSYPLHGLHLDDADVGIDLRETPPDTTAQDTTPLRLAFHVPDGELRRLHFRLTPLNLDIRTDRLATNAMIDVGANRYDVHRVDIGRLRFGMAAFSLPVDTIYGDACVDLPQNLITSNGLHVRADSLGAKADLQATTMNLESMRVDVAGDVAYRGSQARIRGYYDIDDAAYDIRADISRVNARAFKPDLPPIVLAGTVQAQGQGIDPKSPDMTSHVQLALTDAIYDYIDVSGLRLDASLARQTVQGTLHLPVNMANRDMQVRAQTDHRFRVARFLTPEQMDVDYHGRMHGVHAHVAGKHIDVDTLRLDATMADQTVQATLHLPFSLADQDLQVRARTNHQFRVARFLTPRRMAIDYHTTMQDIHALVADEHFDVRTLRLDFLTDTATSLQLASDGLDVQAKTPMHALRFVDRLQPLLRAVGDSTIMKPLTSLSDLTMLDTLRRLVPALQADVELRRGSPVQHIIERMGLDLRQVNLSLASDADRTDLDLTASIPDINPSTHQPINSSTNQPINSSTNPLRLPAVDAKLNVRMTEGKTLASLQADTRLTDGAMTIYDLCSDASLRLDLERTGRELYGTGRLMLDSISYGNRDLGSHAVDMQISPSKAYAHALRADVQLDDIPLALAETFVTLPDIDIRGAVRASASVDGLPAKTDISAEVQPLGVAAEYKPYKIGVSLGETPIIMRHNHVDLNGLPIYGADSTYLALSGGLDLNTMRMDITLEADSFAPAKLPKGGPLPVHGELATDIRGRVTGPLDRIVADVDVTLLPVTDITYPIDKKNLAQVKPHGTVKVRYGVAEGDLAMHGQINVDDGFVRYSPKIYPVMPFHVDSGSHVAFDGPLGRTRLNVSASQHVKADVESEDEETRRVDFITGVRVKGVLDSIGLQSIDFFLEAPDDEDVTRELASLDEETREGLAATLLATGMYVGESNVAAQRDGYALSSIINSRINAALANSKVGKFIDVDVSSGQSTHAQGKTNDMNISISKSFFRDKLRLTLGSTLTDNPEVNTGSGLFTNFSADYKLTKDGNVLLRLYSQRDYNNILEGELYKSGIGVQANKDWRRQQLFRGDSIWRTYSLSADAGLAYRSNNSIGPDLTLRSSVRNVLGHGESFTLKGNGAYYWALRNRHPGDPKKTDTYKLGLNASLVFPYLHWTGDNNPDGDTRYMLGYQYENIAGGYGVHKVSGSLTYFIHSARSPYITHAFTPFSLSVVLMKAETDSLLNKAAEYPQLIKVIAGDEFVPAIGYNFIYDDYRATRAVNTYLNLGIKESGNLLNALYCLGGRKWDDVDKPMGKITFNQFVKLTAELRNRFNFPHRVSIATRLYAGANIPLGNSLFSPLSEAFYTGGPNSLRASSPYAYGPGNFYSAKYNQNFFHSGDVKLEANLELRFPIVWKLYGAAFVDAGNVWNWYSVVDLFKAAGYDDYLTRLQIPETLRDGILNNPDFARQIALGTGAGLRLDMDGLVIRLDLGVGIHSPYQTFRYDKEGKPDTSQPITTYFNMPSALDAIRVNFGIGYPF